AIGWRPPTPTGANLARRSRTMPSCSKPPGIPCISSKVPRPTSSSRRKAICSWPKPSSNPGPSRKGRGPFTRSRMKRCGVEDRSSRGQRTDDRRQTTDDRGQRTDDRRQTTEDRGQTTEDRGQRTEDRRQRTEAELHYGNKDREGLDRLSEGVFLGHENLSSYETLPHGGEVRARKSDPAIVTICVPQLARSV